MSSLRESCADILLGVATPATIRGAIILVENDRIERGGTFDQLEEDRDDWRETAGHLQDELDELRSNLCARCAKRDDATR